LDQENEGCPHIGSDNVDKFLNIIWAQPQRHEENRHRSCSSTYSLLLLGDTDDATATTSGLGVLTTDTDAPVVTETTMSTDLLETLQVLTHLVVKTVGQELGVLAIDEVLLSVEEPLGNLVLSGVLHDGNETLELFVGKLTGSIEMNQIYGTIVNIADKMLCPRMW